MMAQTGTATAPQAEKDAAAREWALMQSIDPWIQTQAKLFARINRVPVDDLIQAGRLKALHYAKRYDTRHGASFFTYTFKVVRRAIYFEATDQANTLGMSRARYRAGEARVLSIHAPLAELGDASFEEIMPAPESTEPYEAVHYSALERALQGLQGAEDSRLWEVIRARFFEGETLAEIAPRLKVTSEAVRQMEKRALDVLRRNPELRTLLNAA